MIRVDGTTITMTRGDTFRAVITINDYDGNVYEPTAADRITFTAKEKYTSDQPLIQIDIPYNTMILEILPEQTKDLKMPKAYVYDIQLTKADGTVDTFIAKATLKIEEEVG